MTPGYAAMRRGRVSAPGAEYFVTFCTEQRKEGLTAATCADALLAELEAMATEQVVEVRCVTIMPDHVHALLRLRGKLPLGRVVARWKARTRTTLSQAGLSWQAGFHEHRLRDGESRLSFSSMSS